MQLTVDRSELLKALSSLHRIVEKRNTIPILSNIAIDAASGMSLKTTDLDIEVSQTISASITQSGATTAPAHLLHDIVRKMPDGAEINLTLDRDGNTLSVKGGRSVFKLHCLPRSDFPELTSNGFSHVFRLESKRLAWLIDKTQFAMSTEETRYYLNGAFFHTVDSRGEIKMRTVATDGHRLSRAEIPAPPGSEGMPGVIIPRKTVNEVRRLVELAETVTIEMSDSKIRFTIGTVVLTSKLIDGTFPDYQRVIPELSNQVAIADRKLLTSAADRVATVSSERGRAIKLDVADGTLNLSVSNPDSGSAQEDIQIDYSGAPMSIGFNVRYLCDLLERVDGANARIYLVDGGSPTVFTAEAETDKDSTFLGVLMPMRV